MEKDTFGRIKTSDTALLIIDIQEKFIPHIDNIDRVVENAARLAKGCRELEIPIIVTEQYPEGLGHRTEKIEEALGKYTPFEKTAFSLFEDKTIKAAIAELGRPNLLVTGIEAHVCLIKTVLDGLAEGYSMHWVADAISSRTKSNRKAAAARAIQCGAFSSSTEMALFQLISSSRDEHFRAISKIVK
ncbi:MAG TPA: hydrolase [bacterium]|nr:hydrolase [bacterium]